MSALRIRSGLLTIVVALSPTLISLILITSRANLSDFRPTWSDEISYWHQILTFKEVGFQGGYYTAQEIPPSAGFTHFFIYGPWYPAFYGLIARVIGWDFSTMLLLNAVLMALAILVFCRVTRLTERQLLLLCLVLMTFWALIFYLFTSMQEAFQQSLAVLIAAVFYGALTKREKTSGRFRIAGGVLIMAAAITRLSWAVLLLPFFILVGQKSVRRGIAYAALSLASTLVVVAIAGYTGVPENNAVFKTLASFSVSPGHGLSQLLGNFYTNIQHFLDFSKDPLDMAQTIQVVALMVGAVVVSILYYRNRRRALPETLFHLYNLGVIIIVICFLYLVGAFRDYRIIAPHLMITLLLLVAFERYRIVLLVVVASLLFAPAFWNDYQSMILTKFNPDHREAQVFQAITHQYIHYDPDTSNPWCNTFLFYTQGYTADLSGIPAGIGLSFFVDPIAPTLTFKSHYLMLDTLNYAAIMARKDAPRLEFLATIPPDRSLYRNESSGCD